MQIKFTVKDKQGNVYTAKVLGEMFNRKPHTIRVWIQNGAKTLSAIRVLSNSVSPTGEKIYDSPYGRLTMVQIAAKSGCERGIAYSRGKKYGFDSIVMTWPEMSKSTFRRRVIKEGIATTAERAGIRKIKCLANGKMYAISTVAKRMNVTPKTINSYMNNNNCETVEDCIAHKESVGTNKVGRPPKKVQYKPKQYPPGSRMTTIPNRTERCHRRDNAGIFDEKCQNYDECTEQIILHQTTPDKFLLDGSCYSGMKLVVECHSETLGRQATDRLGAIGK